MVNLVYIGICAFSENSSAILHMGKGARDCNADLMTWLRTLYLTEDEIVCSLQRLDFILRNGGMMLESRR